MGLLRPIVEISDMDGPVWRSIIWIWVFGMKHNHWVHGVGLPHLRRRCLQSWAFVCGRCCLVGLVSWLRRLRGNHKLTGCHIFKGNPVIDITDCIWQCSLFDSVCDVALGVNNKLIFQEINSNTTLDINSCTNFKRVCILVLLYKKIII